ncbi:MAG: helix-turn-helix domain-containing protein [Neomegalonema sp.]|nr:helix-turn-helix domain-containing protein [Neomegalonema sp.]
MTSMDGDISATFAKGLSVLKAFDATEPEGDLTLAELSRRTGFDRAVVRRLVLTLAHLGYVRQLGRGFRLTPKILVLAGGFLQSRRLVKSLVPILNEYSREIGAPIYLATRDGYDVVFLAHAALESRAIRFGFTIGSRVPLLATSIGRALTAFAPPEQRDELLANAPLKAFTERTSTDRAQIAAALQEARELGYAHVDGEFEAGVAALAMPASLWDEFPAAIGASFERAIFDTEHFKRAIPALRDCRNSLAAVGFGL